MRPLPTIFRTLAVGFVGVALAPSMGRAQATPGAHGDWADDLLAQDRACEAFDVLEGGARQALAGRARAECLGGPARSPAVELPAGTWSETGPAGIHMVAVAAFVMDRDEVTVGEFRRCLESGPCELVHVTDHGLDSACNLGAPGRSDHPINCVDWTAAEDYCEWVGGRLPTEAEQAWAAGGAEDSAHPWGWASLTCDRANFRSGHRDGCGSGTTWPAGAHPDGASPQGIHDLVGNVAEWAADPFVAALPAGHAPASRVPLRHAARGGSFRDGPGDVGRSARMGYRASAQLPEVGFRCSYDVGVPPEPRAQRAAPAHGLDPGAIRARAVLVPGGAFVQGSPRGVGDADEFPRRTHVISPFYLGRTEVTVAEYRQCVLDGGCRSLAFVSGRDDAECNYGTLGAAQHPMNCVSWYGAQEFCHWVGGRLPTEAEWEKAARGVDERPWPWGSEEPHCGLAHLNESGHFDTGGCGMLGTAPVGTNIRGASPYGALDLAGNVGEWTADWYSPHDYALAPERDPPGPLTGSARVTRGGSWIDTPDLVRAAYRFFHNPTEMVSMVGFRCVWPEASSLEDFPGTP